MPAIAVPELDFSPGQVLCLHIPHGFHLQEAAIEQGILRASQHANKSVLICRPATGRRGLREFIRRQRTVEWLARAGDISKADAAQVIDEFGVTVREIMCHNAGTPRCFLGIAAAICRKPDVLLYSSAGLDPLGRVAVHHYVAANGQNLCAVHLSGASAFGDGTPAPRVCPPRARCIELQPG
ncbi:hypothetical protein [Limnoglobus roseus]|nr:hypothetical protein [Limnoglobus roseus]